MKFKLPLLCGVLALAMALGGCQPASSPAVGPTPVVKLRGSGVFRVDEILVSAQTAGAVEWIGAEEGDVVAQGAELARLDTTLIDAQISLAEAALGTAKAQLQKAEAGASTEEITIADAAVTRAAEEAIAAEKAVGVAKGAVARMGALLQTARAEQSRLNAGANPQELASAQERVQIAQDRLAPLNKMREDIGGREQGGAVPPGSYDAAQATLAQAELNAQIARLQVENLGAGPRPEDVQAAQAGVDAVLAGLREAELRVQEAEQRLEAARARQRQAQTQADLVRGGVSTEQINLAEAPVRIADAALRILEVRRKQATLTAPLAGTILERNVNVGEGVLAGTVLYRMSDLKIVELTVYVPGADIGRVHLGQSVTITAGSLAGRTFMGEVIHVSPQAEFNPRSLVDAGAGTSEVFAVKIKVPNADGALRPGMPAEAVFDDS